MKSMFKDPFVHFIMLGALLFVGHTLWQRHIDKTARTISVSAAELSRQAEIFASENRREPTDADQKAILTSYIEEEALMREAQRLGLGENDTIIRRRLAQKMRFLIEDDGAAGTADTDSLQVWFTDNADQFIRPETRTFQHVYFNPDNHTTPLDAIVAEVRSQITDDNWSGFGDPFLMKRTFKDISPHDVTRVFGTAFSNALFALPESGDWQGPITSAFGLHLIRVNQVTPQTRPAFDMIESEVEAAWREDTRRKTNMARMKDLVGQYNVVIEENPSE